MKKTLKILLIVFLAVMLVLAFLPLTGYYAGLGALPVIGLYLYRMIVQKQENAGTILTRRVFLFACAVFLFGFVLNLFCSVYTTFRMVGFRWDIEEQKKRIYGESGHTDVPSSRGTPVGPKPAAAGASEREPK